MVTMLKGTVVIVLVENNNRCCKEQRLPYRWGATVTVCTSGHNGYRTRSTIVTGHATTMGNVLEGAMDAVLAGEQWLACLGVQ